VNAPASQLSFRGRGDRIANWKAGLNYTVFILVVGGQRLLMFDVHVEKHPKEGTGDRFHRFPFLFPFLVDE
jgi:hypothetical protein